MEPPTEFTKLRIPHILGFFNFKVHDLALNKSINECMNVDKLVTITTEMALIHSFNKLLSDWACILVECKITTSYLYASIWKKNWPKEFLTNSFHENLRRLTFDQQQSFIVESQWTFVQNLKKF